MTDLHSVVSVEQVKIEQAFAGCVFVAGTDFSKREAGWLSPETIMTPDIREYWQRILAGEDAIQVAFSMNISADLLKYSQTVPMTTQVKKYANALQEKNYVREGILSAELLAKAASTGDTDTMRSVAASLLQRNDGGGTSMRTPEDIATSLNARIEKGNISIPWGIDSLDAATRGLERGTLTVLGARPSMGKSSLAFQCNETQALEQGLKVAVFALEMSGEQMFARRNCHKVDAMWMDVRAGMIDAQKEARLKDHVTEYGRKLAGKLYVNDDTATTCADIVRIQQREQFDVIMIDHLGLLKDKKQGGERHDQYLGRLTEMLHSLAKDTNCVILLLAQLNRGVEARTDKRPHMGDLRDSGNIEQNADNVILIYGEWYYDASAENTTELIMGKFRDGVKNSTAYVEFDMADQHFKSVNMIDAEEYVEQQMELSNTRTPDEIPF